MSDITSAPAPVKHRKKRTKLDVSPFQWFTLILIALFIIIPFYTTILGGFKSIGELRSNPFGLPESWDPHNFTDIMAGDSLFRSLGNSLVIALATVFFTVVFAATAAFALSNIRFFGSKFVMSFFMVGLLFPAATAVLPLFLVMRDFNLLDTKFGIVVAQVAFSLAFSIVLFSSFFSRLPKELIEAARMDNCGYIRIFWYITLPLSLPIIATVSVFAFVSSWNNFLLPLIMLNNNINYTWPLGIMNFQGQYGTDWPKILSYLTLTIIPAIVFFLGAQRYIISGLTGGSVKG